MIISFLDPLAKLAPLGLFCIALTALIFAKRQLKTVRENEAKKQYLSYLDDCIKFPDFAADYFEDDSRLQYKYFIDKALMAHESLYLEFKKDNEWIKTITDFLFVHKDNLFSSGEKLSINEETSYETDKKILINFACFDKAFQILILELEKDTISASPIQG